GRRPENGPSRRRVERQGGGAEDDADHAAGPDGDGVPGPRIAAGPALQGSDRAPVTDDRRRQADRGIDLTTSPQPAGFRQGRADPTRSPLPCAAGLREQRRSWQALPNNWVGEVARG